jgi:hypothetical protein
MFKAASCDVEMVLDLTNIEREFDIKMVLFRDTLLK